MADTNNPATPGTDQPDDADKPANAAPPQPAADKSAAADAAPADKPDDSAGGPQGAQGESLDGDGDGASDSDQTSGDQADVSPADTDGAADQTKNTDGSTRIDATHSESGAAGGKDADQPEKSPSLFQRLRKSLNIYTGLFIFILLVAAIVVMVAYQQNHKATTGSKIKTQGLSQSTLDQLANSDVTVGNNQSVLTVQSSAIFAGLVLIKQGLEVGGTISLNSLTVAGTSQFGQVNVSRDLAVSGNAAIQGTATVSKGLQVGGGGTFSGPVSAPQITTGGLQLNGDLVLTHHVTAGGPQPGHSGGSALGSGGSVSLSGSDTAGSINVNTGGGPAAGCFVTVNFTSHYSATPHVIITPVGAAAGGLSYYINRSTTNFSVCVASPPPAGRSFGFDYFVID
jgi:hypothetical protein